VVEWLRSDALAGHLGRLGRAQLAEVVRLLPELGPDAPDLPDPAPPPDRDQRRLLFEALTGAVLAAPGPLLLVADDLHWADRETLQFLHYLLRAQPDAPRLVVATVRPEKLDPEHPLHDLVTGLRALDRVAEVEVGRLTAEETEALAERLRRHPLASSPAGRRPAPAATATSPGSARAGPTCAPGAAGSTPTSSPTRARPGSRPPTATASSA
jgi:ATP/maltotriose-dependent transcriptional regulator MalT